MTTDELDAIEARACAASPEPWTEPWSGWVDGPTNVGVVTRSPFVRREDAVFAAHARSDVPRLVAEVRALGGPRGATEIPDPILAAYKRLAAEARMFVDHPTIRAAMVRDADGQRSAYGLLADAIDALDAVLGPHP